MSKPRKPMSGRAAPIALLALLTVLSFPILIRATQGGQESHDGKRRPFIAVLNAGQEAPPNQSGAFGVAFLTLDVPSGMLSYTVSFSDLQAMETVAHFHGPAPAGVNVGVQFHISPPPQGPSPPGSPKTGQVGPLSAQQMRDLKQGLWYINIHSTQYPGGEIRGQVLPVPVTWR